ncbi:MAG: RidA family protein [Acidimicrobiia bacterium]
MSTHDFVNPPELGRPVGFSHVALAAPGRLVFLAGQTAEGPEGLDAPAGPAGIADQFAAAARHLATALVAAGGRPHHLVWLQIFTTDVDAYRAALGPIGVAYREHFGAHYPATGLFGVSRLFHPDAVVELMGIAVIPD